MIPSLMRSRVYTRVFPTVSSPKSVHPLCSRHRETCGVLEDQNRFSMSSRPVRSFSWIEPGHEEDLLSKRLEGSQ